MALQVELPHVEQFLTLPPICAAARHWKDIDGENLARNVGSVFVKHNTYNDYGLILLHRHFDMHDKEILVDTFNAAETVSVALPWVVQGKFSSTLF